MAEEKWLVSGQQTIEVDGVRRLKVGLVGGKIDIVAHDEPGTRIEVHSVDGKELRIRSSGGELELDHVQLGWDNWLDVVRGFRGRDRAEVSVLLPREVALRFGVISATGLITGIQSDATISTVSGELVVDGVEGDIVVNSVSGRVAVRNHAGRVAAHTVSGDLTVQGEVARFSANGVSGAVYLDLAGIPDQVKVNTVSGDVTARLEADAGARYTINTVGGRLDVDGADGTRVRGRYTGRYGELTRRWTDFSVNTVSGDVSVLHAVAV